MEHTMKPLDPKLLELAAQIQDSFLEELEKGNIRAIEAHAENIIDEERGQINGKRWHIVITYAEPILLDEKRLDYIT